MGNDTTGRSPIEWVLLGWFAVGVAGCHSLCSPAGATRGAIAREQTSTRYENETGPYVACRAEATIPTGIALTDADERFGRELDPELAHHQAANVAVSEGYYRVIGLGRGMDRDDCARAAMAACDGIVDSYYAKARKVRELGVVCQLGERRELCPKR